MKNKNILMIATVFFLGVFLALFISKRTVAKSAVEIRCQPIDWYIGNRLHKKKGFSDGYNDNTVRCENEEVICYIYHGQPSCVKK